MIIGTDIDVEGIERYANDSWLNVSISNVYTITFCIVIDESVIESSTQLKFDDDLSFSKAKEIIENLFKGKSILLATTN